MVTQDSDKNEPVGRETPVPAVGLGWHMVESETEDVMLYIPAAVRLHRPSQLLLTVTAHQRAQRA